MTALESAILSAIGEQFDVGVLQTEMMQRLRGAFVERPMRRRGR